MQLCAVLKKEPLGTRMPLAIPASVVAVRLYKLHAIRDCCFLSSKAS